MAFLSLLSTIGTFAVTAATFALKGAVVVAKVGAKSVKIGTKVLKKVARSTGRGVSKMYTAIKERRKENIPKRERSPVSDELLNADCYYGKPLRQTEPINLNQDVAEVSKSYCKERVKSINLEKRNVDNSIIEEPKVKPHELIQNRIDNNYQKS